MTVPILALVIWGLWSAGSDTYYFPPLTEILSTFADTWLFERVGSDVVPSLVRMGLGFAIAVVVASRRSACCSACRAGRAAPPRRSSSSCARSRRPRCCRSRSS